MKKEYILFKLLICLILLLPQSACSKSKKGYEVATIQPPVVAGAFYPANPSKLKSDVEKFLAEAKRKSFDGRVIAVVAPHAGYKYSGAIAGSAFKQVEGMNFKRVIVMGPTHRVPLTGVALSTKDLYRTPLGDIMMDVDTIKRMIAKYDWAKDDPRPYRVEHSIEVELPFLQVALGKNFKLIPMIIGAHNEKILDQIAKDLNDMFPSDETLFVVSSDLSHYEPYDKAVEIDKKTIEFICDRKPDEFYAAVEGGKASLCGSSPVYIMKRIAEMRNANFELIEYANSGDTAGDKSRVVGYAAIAVVRPSGFTKKQREGLLILARKTLEAHVRGRGLPKLSADPTFKKDGAAFVTLKKNGMLRGCIGHIIAQGPLDKTVQEMTVAAASNDPRFKPVKPEELKDIHIEISVLTPPELLSDPLAVRVGTDGLIIEKGFNRGVLLPQVPTEQGWDKRQYLAGICRKAGLPPDGWKDAKLERFQAIVFGE